MRNDLLCKLLALFRLALLPPLVLDDGERRLSGDEFLPVKPATRQFCGPTEMSSRSAAARCGGAPQTSGQQSQPLPWIVYLQPRQQEQQQVRSERRLQFSASGVSAIFQYS